MKLVYVEFYDLVYTDGWSSIDFDIEDSKHKGVGVLLEDNKDYLLIALAIGNDKDRPFSQLMIPKLMLITSIVFDSKMLTDRTFINGFGEIGGGSCGEC
jgi:hypothetical protein